MRENGAIRIPRLTPQLQPQIRATAPIAPGIIMSATTPQESKSRQLRLAPFALALICFLLPFVEVSCQGQKLADLNGVQLSFGTTLQQRDPFSGQIKTQHVNREPLVLGALIGAVLATAYCFVPGPRGKKVSAILGLLTLLLLLFAKSKISSDALREGNGVLQVNFGIGYTFTCVLLVVGAAISFWQMSQSTPAPAAAPPPPPA